MLCQKCKKNQATSHIKQVINGDVKEYFLCSKCADELGIYGFVGSMDLDLDSFFSGFFSKPSLADSKRMICPNCKSTLSDISKSGKVGCSECYNVFRDELMPILQRLHGDVSHRGKIPENALKSLSDEQKIEKLQEELEKAVKEQKYELAAKYRDEIHNIKNKKDGE